MLSGGVVPKAHNRTGRSHRTAISVAILICVYIPLALTFSLLTRAWEPNDEPAHTNYIEFIVRHGAIPRISVANGIESQQPPLYYEVGAAWQTLLRIPGFAVFNHAVPPDTPYQQLQYSTHYSPRQRRFAIDLRELRLLSVVFGLGTVLLAYAAAKILLLGEGAALSVGLFVALLPKELVVSASVSNDSLVIMLCALALVCFLESEKSLAAGVLRRRRNWVAATGLVLGAAAITKFNSLPVAGILFGVMAWPALRAAKRWYAKRGRGDDEDAGLTRRLFGDVAAGAVAFVVVSGWWFVRNAHLYGSALATTASTNNVTAATDGYYHPAHSSAHVLFHIVPDSLFRTGWYDGFGNELQLPWEINLVLGILGVASVAAGVWVLWSRSSAVAPLAGLEPQALIGCVIGAIIACALVAHSTSFVEGRIAYVALVAFAIIAVVGTKAMIGRTGATPWAALLVWPVALAALDAYVLVHFVIPLRGL